MPAKCDSILGDRPRWWGISRGLLFDEDRIIVWNVDSNGLDYWPIQYSVDEWVHIALVHDGGFLRVYKNGAEVTNIASGTTLQPINGALPLLQLGGIINNAERRWLFEGELDEVQLWDVALSSDQIRQNMYRELTGSESGLAAYYQMSDGSGLTLTDNSGNGLDGTLTSGGIEVPVGQPPTWITSGAFSGPRNALEFDGINDYVDLETNSNTMIGGGWTDTKSASIWIKPTGTSPTVADAGTGDWIFGAYDGSNALWGVLKQQLGQKIRFGSGTTMAQKIELV